jgi:DNA-binding response OmpR family regulator
MLKQLIYRLRQKLEIQPDYTHFIETIPGVGYALVKQEKR